MEARITRDLPELGGQYKEIIKAEGSVHRGGLHLCTLINVPVSSM